MADLLSILSKAKAKKTTKRKTARFPYANFKPMQDDNAKTVWYMITQDYLQCEEERELTDDEVENMLKIAPKLRDMVYQKLKQGKRVVLWYSKKRQQGWVVYEGSDGFIGFYFI